MEWEGVEQCTSIASLPPQLLTHILRKLSTQDRLCCCALVSRAWHKAALAATTSISGSSWPRGKVQNLSGWLQAHGTAVAIGSITVAAEVHPPPLDIFELPSHQLTNLRSLDLSRLVVRPAGHEAATAAALLAQALGEADSDEAAGSSVLLSVFAPEISALTRLSFEDCTVNLAGLEVLTDLRSLSLRYSRRFNAPQRLHSGNIETLAAALPLQPQLTALELHGQFCSAAVIGAAGASPALQSLRLAGMIRTDDLAKMPGGLTCFHLYSWYLELISFPSFTAAATPRVCQLTALQELSLQYVGTFHPAVLSEMRDLRTLCVWCHSIDKGVAEPGLEVLTRLKKLQSIQVRAGRLEDAVATAEGIAALTSSTALTGLDVLGIPRAHFSTLFPEGRQMPRLLELSLNEQLLLQHETLSKAVINCPHLTRLVVHAPEDPEQQQAAPIFPVQVCHGLRHLTALQHLQSLQLGWCPFNAECWQTVATLPSLKQLTVSDGELSTAEGIMAMTECRALTCLEVELYPVMPAGYDALFKFEVQNKAPAGSPPDVWCRLPAAVNRFALDVIESDDAETVPDHVALRVFHHLTATAAAATGTIQTEQQQELLSLRQRTAALEAVQVQQQQETAVLQQQVQEMQAALQQLLRMQQ